MMKIVYGLGNLFTVKKINMRNSKFLTVHDLFLTMMKIVYGLRNIFTVNHINIPSI